MNLAPTPTLTERVELARLQKGRAIDDHMRLSAILNCAHEVGLENLMLERLRALYRESAEAVTTAQQGYNALRLELYFHKMGALSA